jgi:hypothetical protein
LMRVGVTFCESGEERTLRGLSWLGQGP